MKKLDPITPGEILSEEFLGPMGFSQYRFADPDISRVDLGAGARRPT